ncbi:MAG: serine protease [Methylococcaceae bacterium]|nr:serine protease [Methylococcaceae bacterium]
MTVAVLSFCNRQGRHPVARRPARRFRIVLAGLTGLLALLGPVRAFAADASKFPELVARVKQSIVGVGTFDPVGVPPYNLLGTGFAVGDGLSIVTCAHVIPNRSNIPKKGFLAIFSGQGFQTGTRRAALDRFDDQHDVAILKIGGNPLPTLALGGRSPVREGEVLAFTGFPIGQVLGFVPVTHRGMVSALTPIVQPAMRGVQLNPMLIRQLRDPFTVIQLDGTAYPGNSGGPLYDMASGVVVGMINMVFVKERKEYALSAPSGISFAIPSIHIENLLAARP